MGMGLSAQTLDQRLPILSMTPGPGLLITGSHAGYRPDCPKRIFIRNSGPGRMLELSREGSREPLRELTIDGAPDALDPALRSVSIPGLYGEGRYSVRLAGGNGPEFSFAAGADVWLRTLQVLGGYAHRQRCGQSDRAGHPLCHLDDARRRDTGEHVDVTGGWHDAGDLRKWVDATLMNLFGLAALAGSAGWRAAGTLNPAALLDEIKYGNAFFLKMQDTDGLVWADVGGGIHGDNSDNHWTDNQSGTADDRWINVEKRPGVQAMFIAAEIITSRLFARVDPPYARRCLDAALRCWDAGRSAPFREVSNTTDLAWAVIAGSELAAATRASGICRQAADLVSRLAATQVEIPEGAKTPVRGFFTMWPGHPEPLRDAVHSAIPAVALLHASQSLGVSLPSESIRWRSRVRTYIDEYAAPLASFSGYGILPFGLFLDVAPSAKAAERYRSLSSRYSWRFFMPVTGHAGFSGLNSHLLSHALLFAAAAAAFGDSRYRDLSYAHLEWVFGANPFGASLVTGVGYNQPPAFSPFTGLIPGGIMNGIAGNEQDLPVLNQKSAADWRTNEYWSPHSGYCLWALSLLEGRDARLGAPI